MSTNKKLYIFIGFISCVLIVAGLHLLDRPNIRAWSIESSGDIILKEEYDKKLLFPIINREVEPYCISTYSHTKNHVFMSALIFRNISSANILFDNIDNFEAWSSIKPIEKHHNNLTKEALIRKIVIYNQRFNIELEEKTITSIYVGKFGYLLYYSYLEKAVVFGNI